MSTTGPNIEARIWLRRGLRIRCDWGPQYIADTWTTEVKWLGISRQP